MKDLVNKVEKILEKDIVRKILSFIALFLYLLYAYNISINEYIYSSRKFLFLSLMLPIFIFFVMYIKKMKNMVPLTTKTFIMCALLFGIIIINNRDLATGHLGAPFYYAITIALFFILTNSKDWNEIAISVMKLFTIEHVICTWLFYFMPELYQNYIMPIFPEMFQPDLMYQFKHNQIAGLTYHYSTNGMYLALGTIIFMGEFLKKNTKKEKIINGILFVLTLGALLLTGKRGHLLFSVCTVFLMILVSIKGNFKKNFKKYLKTMGIALVVVVLLFSISVKFIPALNNTFERFAEFAGSKDITNGRLPYYKLALEKFKESPLIGNGWGSYKYIFEENLKNETYGQMETHNIYLQLLCETGVIGVAVVLGIFGYTLFITYKLLSDKKISDNSKEYLIISFGIQVFVLLYGMTGNPIYDTQIYFEYMIAMAIAYSIRNDSVSSIIEEKGPYLPKERNSKKIGILTFQNTANYGAELQKYALQKYISNQGYMPEVIDYKCKNIEEREAPMQILKQRSISNIIKCIFRSDSQYKRYIKFINFAKKNVNTTNKIYNKDNIKELNELYDMFIVGSDQVWNMSITGGDTTYMLDFASDNKCKKSYAASFGYSEIPQNYYEDSKKYISQFDKINVRENTGKEIIEKFVSDKKVNVTIDPTFLLEENEWNNLVDEERLYKKDYIFVYLPYYSKEVFNFIHDLAKKEKCKIVYIHGSLRSEFGMINLRDASVEDFLNLVKNAKYVVTGSFHAICFSIIFKKQFFYTVSAHKQFNSRLCDLIELVDLKDRKVESSTYDKIKDIDFNKVKDRLSNSINDSKSTLNEMLEEA